MAFALLACACTKSVQVPVSYYVPLQGGEGSRLKALACFDRCDGVAACVRTCPGIASEEDTTCSELSRSRYSACTDHVTRVNRIDAVGIALGAVVGVALSVAIFVGLAATMGE